MSHVVSKTSDTAYIGLTALWALLVDAQKVSEWNLFIDQDFAFAIEIQGKAAVHGSNVLPAPYDVWTQQRNKENLLCYHAVSNVIQLLTKD